VKRFLLFLPLILFSYGCLAQIDMWSRTTSFKPYTAAITLVNPLAFMGKFGGGVEHRYGNMSYMIGYYKYVGVYVGDMAELDLRKYMRRRYVHQKLKWNYQNFVYARLIAGTAAFDGDRVPFLGYPSGTTWYDQVYAGGAAGYGRRYNRGIFFVTVRGGLKGVALDITEEEAKPLYRNFYIAGPGSVVEVNLQFGIQL